MRLAEISERDRAFLWAAGLLGTGAFFEEVRAWGGDPATRAPRRGPIPHEGDPEIPAHIGSIDGQPPLTAPRLAPAGPGGIGATAVRQTVSSWAQGDDPCDDCHA